MNDTSNALLTGQISGALRLDSPLMTPTEAPASLFPGPSTTLAKGKRAREEDEAKVEAWTDEDIELVRATVLHPFRPLSSAYPPGELAPPHILDEITTQIVNCSSDQRLLSSKARRALTKSRALAGSGSLAGLSSSPITRSTSASSSASIESPTSTSSGSSGSSGSLTPQASSHAQSARWPHSWEATRRRVYLASVEATREAHGLILHKEEKREKNRPSLRRVDSMDFLNQVDMEDDQEGQNEGGARSGLGVPALGEVGRAMRLSTTLQNSTKFSPSPMLLRSASMGSGLNVLSTSSATSTDQPMPVRPASPIRASTGSIGPILTVTPASPQKAPTRKASAPVPTSGNTNSNLITKQKSTAQAQVPSIRKNRTPRPSLLQRGRSFTASDLGSINGDASDEEAGGEQDEANDGARAAKGKGKSLSSPNTPWQGTIPLGMGMTSMTSLSALSAPAPAVSVAESSRRPSSGVTVDYDTSPMTLSDPVIPAQPFLLDDGDSLMCDSPPNLSPTKGRVDKSVPAGFGLGLPTSASAPLLASSLFPSPPSSSLQAHLASPPSPRTRRRSQALGNESTANSSSSTPTSTSSGLQAGAMIEDAPASSICRPGAKHGGWSDTDDDADAGSDSGHGRTRKRAMKRHVSNNNNKGSSGSRSDKVQVEMGKGAGIGRSGSMAYLKQTCAGEGLTFGSALGVGASREGSGKAGLASPFDEKTGFLL